MLLSTDVWPRRIRPIVGLIVVGRPCRETNLLRHAMKESVDRSNTNSMWTAFVVRHTNMQAYPFTHTGFLVWPLRRVNGPAKSAPVAVKGGAGVARIGGS